jgi:hypothetical protein
VSLSRSGKARHGIVTSLPMSDEPPPVKAPRARPVPKPPSKEERDEVLRVIIGMIDQFCREHLNEEYAVLCRKLAEKLARKRPSPLLHGSPNTGCHCRGIAFRILGSLPLNSFPGEAFLAPPASRQERQARGRGNERGHTRSCAPISTI